MVHGRQQATERDDAPEQKSGDAERPATRNDRDLVQRVVAGQHQVFRGRQLADLREVSLPQPVQGLGAEIDVPTLDGDEKLKIPAGTQPGKVFNMRGKGVPHLRRNGRGDQLVIVNVAVPTKLSKEQRELFEELAKSLGTTVKPQEKGFLDWLNEALGG